MKTKITYIFTILISLITVSCNDFLDVDPTLRAYLKSPEDVSKLLVNAYPQACSLEFMEIRSDNVGDNQKWIEPSILSLVERQLSQDFWWETVSNQYQDTPTDYWNGCYSAIAHANLAIQYIEQVSDPENYKAQLGEALVCRAYAHFMLTVFFSKPYNEATANTDLGVPYPTEPETEVFKKYKRETLQKTYELIEKDLTIGLPLISNSYKVGKYHFNSSAANAFACRFYLFKHDWKKAVEYANLALGSNAASLLRDWNGKYNSLPDKELEAIYTNYTEDAILLMADVRSWYPYFSYYRYVSLKNISNEIYGEKGKFNITGDEFVARPNLSFQGGVNEVFRLKYKGWEKRTSIDATSFSLYLMNPLFTAEEVLLNRAEANAMQGNVNDVCKDLSIYYSKRIKDYSAVKDAVTEAKINNFANYLYGASNELSPVGYTIPDNSKNMVKVIIDTKRKEFIHEGNRWYDIKRFNIEVKHTSYDNTKTDILKKDDLRRELQIPEDAKAFGIEANPR